MVNNNPRGRRRSWCARLSAGHARRLHTPRQTRAAAQGHASTYALRAKQRPPDVLRVLRTLAEGALGVAAPRETLEQGVHRARYRRFGRCKPPSSPVHAILAALSRPHPRT